MKKLILLAVMCLVYHTLFADETTPTPKSDAHLYGHVIDSKTGEHLPYATVTIPGTTIGAVTRSSASWADRFSWNMSLTCLIAFSVFSVLPSRLRYPAGFISVISMLFVRCGNGVAG